MNNREIQAARKYHDGSKHSYWSIRNHAHFLDWANRPLPFKIYPKVEPLRLPRDVQQTGVAALSAISQPVPSSRADSVPGVQDLARILYFSAVITKQRAYPGGEIYFRAAACIGALYEIELYVVTGDLPGLDAGVYHFNPADVSLRLLRRGNFRGNLAQATVMEPAVAHAPATIICTGTYWRNAWKYQARTYRHFGWDNGTLLANMLAVSAASGLPAEVVLGFVDGEVNRLLDLDPRHEVCLCLVPIGTSESSLPAPREAPPLGLETIPLSQHEVEYPAMLEMHNASSLESVEEVSQWRANARHLGLEQELPADAGVDIFFLADLKRILEHYGNRGYRAVQLEAGAIGGRIYLAAYAQRLGATGLTFFDDDVVTFFFPHAKDKSAIFLVAIGKPLKRELQ